jgi:hypothetical protein
MALVGVLWAGLLCLPPKAVAAGFTLMSERGEIETGKKLDDEIGNKMGFYTEPKLQAYVSDVVRRLVRALRPMPLRRWEVSSTSRAACWRS